MKLNKKLLVFALSVLMLVGLLAVAAFAAGESDVLTIKYMDGTVQTYAKGETVVPPAVPSEFVYVAEDGKAYKYTATGTAWEGIPATVADEHLGQTINATVAGTQGTQQVYYVTWEKLTADAEFRVIYHYENNVHQYLSTSNKGDKGDGTNTGAYSAQELGSSGSAGMIRIKLYWDVDVSSFSINIMPSPRKSQGVNTYFDLNGHTVKTSQTGYIDGKAVHIRIYSSVPGAHFYLTGASSMFRANDDCGFYLGSESSELNYGDEDNISFHGKAIFGTMYGGGGQIWGGKFYQTGESSTGFLDLSRRITVVSGAEFYSMNGVAPLTDTVGHDGASIATGSVSIKNCTFYNATGAPVVTATKSPKLVFDNCTFVNVYANATMDGATTIVRDGCLSNVGSSAPYVASAGTYVFARVDAIAVAGLTDATGAPIAATVNYAITDPASALKINTSAGAEYWAIGTTFSTSAGDYVQVTNAGILLTQPEYDVADVAEIVDGKVAAAGEITLAVVFKGQTPAAFTYKDTATGKLYGVSYEECGSTAAGVFEKFYELFNAPKAGYVITMYQDMTVNKAMGFGPLVVDTSDSTWNRDYYNTLSAGSIVWDLNGTTVTVSADTTGFINPTAANHKHTEPNGWNSGNPKTVFCFEGYNKDNTFTIKSSATGGKIVNLATAALFGVGEGKATRVVFEGEGLTVESANHMIFYGIELGYDFVSLADPRMTINGGTFISGYSSGIMQFCGNSSVSNATFISTNASVAQLTNLDAYRNGKITFDNVTFIAAKDSAPAFYSTLQSGRTRNATFNNCVYIGCEPTTTTRSPITSLTYTGTNLASTETNLALINASAPAGTAKYTFMIAAADGNVYSVLGYAAADQVLSVTYVGANVTENYLVGKPYAPLAMLPAYYEIVADLVNGTVNVPEAWAGIPAAGIVDATYGGKIVNATPADNILAIAFALVENDVVTAYALVDAAEIGDALTAALDAQASAGTLYIYQNIEADYLTVTKALVIELNDNMLTLVSDIYTLAGLTINNGEINALGSSYILWGNTDTDITLNNVQIYSRANSVFYSGGATAYLNDVVIANSYPASLTLGAPVVINGAKLVNLAINGNVTVVGGTLLATLPVNGVEYADGVYGDLIVNNNKETLTVAGKTVEAVYVVAATADAAKAIEIVYVFDGVVRGSQNYFYGSIANFYKEFTEGYYFSYDGKNVLTQSGEVECEFHADESKLKAQVVLTDALNYAFYLQVEDAGVLANLKLNGVAFDLADLEQETINGVQFYVIPVAFATFADALNNYVLSVDLVGAESSLTITAEASLAQYLGEVLATADEADAKIAYAVAEYIEALMAYFDYDLAFGDIRMKNLARVSNLLADYAEYKVALPELPAETLVASDYVSSVLLVANEKITFAFCIPNNFAGAIKINGVAVEISKAFEGFDRTYALAEVAFADLDETLTVTVENAYGDVFETLTYSLADYIAGVAAQNEGVAADYAKALWKLAAVIG